MKTSLGRLTFLPNINRKFGSANQYAHVWVRIGYSKDTWDLLLTQEELENARDRAKKNPEDLPARPGWLSRLLGRLLA